MVKGCLNYFCPIKYLLVRVFFFVCFASLVWVFSFQLSHLLFIEIQCHDFPAQFGSGIECPGTSLRQFKSTQGKHNFQGDLPLSPIHRLSSLDCYSSPPKLLFPLPQLLQAFLWRSYQASPSFLKAGWSGSNCRASQAKWISLQGAQSDPHSSPVISHRDFTHSFLLEKQVKSHRQ